MLAYQKEQEQKRLKAEREAREKEEETRKKLEAGQITEKAAEKQLAKVEEKLEKAPEVIKSSETFHTRKNKKFRIVNVDLIPRAFLIADEVAIRKAMMAGTEIAGVEYYEESTLI